MIAAPSKSGTKQFVAMSAWKGAYVDSGTMAHMAMDDAVLSMNKKLNRRYIGMAGNDVVKAEREGTSDHQLSQETGQVKSGHILHVPNIALNLFSVVGLGDDGHTVQFTNNISVVKMKKTTWF